MALCVIIVLFASTICFGSLDAGSETFRFGWCQGGEFVGTEGVAKDFTDYITMRMHVETLAVKAASREQLERMLKNGEIDFAFISNYGYPSIASSTVLLATPEINGSTFMQLYVVVSVKSGIYSIAQLRGRRAAKVDSSSRLHCNFMASAIHGNPRRYFKEVKRYRELRDAVYAVADGKADATCLNSDMYNLLIKYDPSLAKKLRIIKRSSVYPLHPFVASSQLAPDRLKKLKKLCFYMNSDYAAQNVLMLMGIQGFEKPVTDLSLYPGRLLAVKDSEPKTVLKSHVKRAKAGKREKKASQNVRGAHHVVAKPDHLSKVVSEHKDGRKKEVISPAGVDNKGALSTSEQMVQRSDSKGEPSAMVSLPKSSEMSSVNMTAPDGEEEKFSDNITASEKIVTNNVGNVAHTFGSQRPFDVLNGSFVGKFLHIVRRPGHSNIRRDMFLAFFAIIFVCLVGFAVLRFVRRLRRRQKLTVVAVVKENIISMQCVMDSEKDIAFRDCDISPRPDDFGTVAFWERYMKETGHLAGMRLLGVIAGDRCRLHYYALPVLPASEIVAALEWKLKDDNIPYLPEDDFIQYSIIRKDRKNKRMVVLAEVFKREDVAWIYPEGKKIAHGIVSLESCLLNCLSQAHDTSKSGRCALVYRFSRDEALMIFYHHLSDVFSRRLFPGPLAGDATDVPDDSIWAGFVTDIAQTLRFYRDRYGVVNMLYLAGNGVEENPDPDGVLANVLDVTIQGLDVFQGVKDRTDLLNVCPQPEVMIGAARAWFSGKFQFSS
jgi:ABC-type phosphate/phosphonate transport system substrate-binding protein